MTAELVVQPVRANTAEARRRVALRVLSGEYAGQGLPLVLPIEPLARQVWMLGGILQLTYEVAGMRGLRLKRSYERGVAAGYVSWKVADELAIELLGMHPCMVWGDAWFGQRRSARRATPVHEGRFTFMQDGDD